MIDQDLIRAFNSQLTFERYSADVYYSLACQLDYLNFTGLCSYMHKRAEEERTHAKKFSDYLADRNVLPVIDTLQKPPVNIIGSLADSLSSSARLAFESALEHERVVTERIKNLYKLCDEDPQAAVFLHWFLAEQVEEERTLEEIIARFDMGITAYEIDEEYRD